MILSHCLFVFRSKETNVWRYVRSTMCTSLCTKLLRPTTTTTPNVLSFSMCRSTMSMHASPLCPNDGTNGTTRDDGTYGTTRIYGTMWPNGTLWTPRATRSTCSSRKTMPTSVCTSTSPHPGNSNSTTMPASLPTDRMLSTTTDDVHASTNDAIMHAFMCSFVLRSLNA